MAKIRIILEDDNGNPIGDKEKIYNLKLGKEKLMDIEAAVEKFKQEALPKLEKELMIEAQKKFLKQKKT